MLGAGCADEVPTAASRPLWSPLAAPEWNAHARSLVALTHTDPPFASRVYALTSIASLRAAERAEASTSQPRPSVHAAIAAAASSVLLSLYPDERARIMALTDASLGTPDWSRDPAYSVLDGVRLGREVAAQLLAERDDDGWDKRWHDALPSDSTLWMSQQVPAAPPLRPVWGEVRPWVLSRGNLLRPPAPPAAGSDLFTSALDEVRRVTSLRTSREAEIARHWAGGSGTSTPPGQWNALATELVLWYNLDERSAARVLALVNMAMMDAGIAVWDAKYAYWCLRPTQSDPSISLAVSLPNFPAYPSGHAGFSGAAATVLARLFPNERARLDRYASEAATSRLYGGIHFHFDNTTGLQLGTAIGDSVLAREQRTAGAPLQRHTSRVPADMSW